MDFLELKTRIEKGENLHTEFKQWPLGADELSSAIVAFANTDGGQIFLGVDDQKQIVGIPEAESDRINQFVDNVAFNNCDPPITVIQETIRTQQEQTILVLNIPKGDQRPYRTQRGVYYIRTSSGRRQASREELLRLFQATESFYYDETPILRAKVSDLDNQSVERLLKDIQQQGFDVAHIAQDRLLENWCLTVEKNGERCPTVAGILFLARFPQQFIPYACISALRIPGEKIAIEPSDQKRIEGRLVEVLHDTLRFLEIHLMRPHRIEQLKPEVKPELPVEVLREVLVNALTHRDYTLSSPIRVIVFDDRIEIRTPGQLPNTVTIEAIKLGVHVLRNPTLYNLFLKIGLVTDAGSGVPRIIHLMSQQIGREPHFCMEGNEFVVKIPRKGVH